MQPKSDPARVAATVIDREQIRYSLWFYVPSTGRQWAPWSSECRDAARAASERAECLRRFPGAETVLVMTTEKRETLDLNREANLTRRHDAVV